MDTAITTENQLVADIEQLREKFPNTQDLYREVCTVMFFRYGITPTANKLYQYVKKGSMNAPAEALGKFWDILREKSRVRIERPDLPDEIKTGAGELAAALWDLAQGKAATALREYEAEARASVIDAKSALTNVEAQCDALRGESNKAQANLAQAREQISELQQQLAAAAATREILDAQLVQTRVDIAAHRQANESARQYFAEEIEKLRHEAQLAEERFRATEKRALLDVDRERSVATRLQKELDGARADAAKEVAQYRLENLGLQQQLGDMRQQLGVLEGQLRAAEVNREQMMQDLHAIQAQATDAAKQVTSIEADRNSWRIRAEHAEKELHELKERPLRTRPARKLNTSSKGP